MGFVGSDGSELAGALNPSNQTQGLQVDGSGNLKIAGSFSATNPSTSTNGAAAPGSSTQVGASDGTNLQPLQVESSSNKNLRTALYNGANEAAVDAAGNQSVKLGASLPAGANTIGYVGLIAGTALEGGVNVVDGAGTNKLAVDASGRLTLAPNQSANVAQVGGSALALGQTTKSGSVPVALASDQGNLATNIAQINGVTPGLDNTNELRVSMYGKNSAAGDMPMLLDASGRAQANIAQWAGAAPSVSNPVVVQQTIQQYINAGQGFSASTGKQTSGGAVQTGACIWNNSTAKSFLIYSIRVGIAASSVHQINLVTVDPAISGVTMTASNSKPGGATSLATLEAQNTAVTTSGNLHDFVYNSANTMTEFLQNGATILLPASAANGVLILVNTSTNVWFVSLKWIEY